MICACTHIMECLICRWFLTVEKLDLNFLPGATNAKIVVLNSQSPCQDKGISRLSWCARVPQELMLWHEQKIFLSSYQGILCKPLFAVTLLCSFCLFSIYSVLASFPQTCSLKIRLVNCGGRQGEGQKCCCSHFKELAAHLSFSHCPCLWWFTSAFWF